jgi:hypothetical protein
MHLCERIICVKALGEPFDVAGILEAWPDERWPLPRKWTVARDW